MFTTLAVATVVSGVLGWAPPPPPKRHMNSTELAELVRAPHASIYAFIYLEYHDLLRFNVPMIVASETYGCSYRLTVNFIYKEMSTTSELILIVTVGVAQRLAVYQPRCDQS